MEPADAGTSRTLGAPESGAGGDPALRTRALVARGGRLARFARLAVATRVVSTRVPLRCGGGREEDEITIRGFHLRVAARGVG